MTHEQMTSRVMTLSRDPLDLTVMIGYKSHLWSSLLTKRKVTCHIPQDAVISATYLGFTKWLS